MSDAVQGARRILRGPLTIITDEEIVVIVTGESITVPADAVQDARYAADSQAAEIHRHYRL